MENQPEQPKVPDIRMIPIADLIVPEWNPRKFIDEAEMLNLVAFLKKGSIVPRIWVWKGTGQAPWLIIAGQRRMEAHRRLGRTHIEAEIMDFDLEEAKIQAIASNRDDKPYWLGEYAAVENLTIEYPNLRQVELADRLGWSEAWVSRALSIMQLLTPASRGLIEQNTRQEVKLFNSVKGNKGQSTPGDKVWRLKEAAGYRLTRLLTKDRELTKAQALVEKVLPIMLSGHYTAGQTNEVVAWVNSGKALAEFQLGEKARKSRSKGVGSETHPKPVETPNLSQEARMPPARPIHSHQLVPETPPTAEPSPKHGGGATDEKDSKPSLILEAMVGISPFQAIRAKIKKGEKITREDWLLLLAHWTWVPAKWVWKHGLLKGLREVLKWEHHAMKEVAHFMVPHSSHSSSSRSSGHHSGSSGSSSPKPLQALAHWGVYVFCQFVLLDALLSLAPPLKPWVEYPFRWLAHEGLVVFPAIAWDYAKHNRIVGGIIAVFVIIGLIQAIFHKPKQTWPLIGLLVALWFYGRMWSDDLKLQTLFPKPVVNAPTPIPTQPPVAVSKTSEPKKAKVAVVKSQPDSPEENINTSMDAQGSEAFNGDSTDLALLKSVIASFPFNVVIKSCPVTPDPTINPLMAVNRLGDLAVESEYSLRVGQGGQKIKFDYPLRHWRGDCHRRRIALRRTLGRRIEDWVLFRGCAINLL